MPDSANGKAASAPIQKRKALVVDDYMLIRRNHRALLEKFGFDVIESADGEEALKHLREAGPGSFHLMIVDLVMPVMNGADLIALCRKEFGKTMPQIIVCSSVSELPIVKKIVALGIEGYLVKPIDYRLFIKKLNELFPDIPVHMAR